MKPGSDTETYGAFRLDFDSPRWGGVPFFLRAGKALEDTVTEMTIEFSRRPGRCGSTTAAPTPPQHDPHRGQARTTSPP